MNNREPSQGKLVTSATCFLMKGEVGASAAQRRRTIYIGASTLSEVRDLNTTFMLMENL